ncbi:MAG: hypothetical protein R3C49_26865 [Planctomycetaceae bacterium]
MWLSLAVLVAGCSSEQAENSKAAAGGGNTAEAAVRQIQEGLANNNPAVVWESLPESYRNDLNDIVRTFASGMDAGAWKQITDLLNSIHQLLTTKQEFILGYPSVAQGGEPEKSKQVVEGASGVLNALLQSVTDLEKLKSFDGHEFMTSSGVDLMNHLKSISEVAPKSPGQPVGLMSLSDVRVETVEQLDSTATLKFTSADGHQETVDFVLVDGKWMSKPLVDEWDEKMQSTRESLKDLPEQMAGLKFQIIAVTGMVNGALVPLQSAERSGTVQRCRRQYDGDDRRTGRRFWRLWKSVRRRRLNTPGLQPLSAARARSGGNKLTSVVARP